VDRPFRQCLVLLVAVIITAGFEVGGATYQFVESHQWDTGLGAGYSLGVDGIAMVLILLTVVLIPLLLVAGWNDGGERGAPAFIALVLTIESMVLIAVVSLDVLLFYVFFEAMLIPDVLPDRRLRQRRRTITAPR